MNCKFLELRVLDGIGMDEVSSFVSKFKNTSVQCIDVFFPFVNLETYSELLKMKEDLFDIRWLFMYNTPKSIAEKIELYREPETLVLTSGIRKSECGVILPYYFSINIPTYTESNHFNSCLNCKIAVDENGEIRNCPSTAKSFGNITTTSLEQALENKDYNILGKIKKDEIKICKDCEYRHICTDCRAFIEDPNDIYSKPLKCGYNPYTGIWEEWSKNPLKQSAIDYYQMRDSSSI